MRKQYMSAPLPFMGQKRMFAKEFVKVLGQFRDKTVFVDLFGGSGLLSHITKCQRPDATVVYNDFDGYNRRLQAIPQTNALLADLREIAKDTPRHKPIKGEARERIFERIIREERERGYVDFITLSASLMFSMKYQLNVDGMRKEVLYNTIRMTDYPLCHDYLDGLTVTSCDYKELYEQYQDVPGVVFLVDPPYLSTEAGIYKMYWRLSDYLDVLNVRRDKPFVFFTSNKSSLIELCEWIGRNQAIGNPFNGRQRIEFNAQMNYAAKYTDIMLYKSQSDFDCEKAA